MGRTRTLSAFASILAAVAAWLASRAGAFRGLFSANYLPHRYCYLIQPALVWTNVTTDTLIGIAYGLIFACLFWITFRLRRLEGMRKYLWVFASFGLFIAACGATHFMEVVTVWLPVYPLSAAFKVLCALVSVPTAIYFAYKTPAIEAALATYTQRLDTTQQQRDSALTDLNESKMLVDVVADYAIYLLGPTGLISTWNLGAQRIKGYRADEIVGQHFSIFFPPEVDQITPAEELEFAEREGRFETEGWRRRKDGSIFWAHIVLSTIRRRNGSLLGFTKVTQDLTGKRTVEEALQLSNNKLAHTASELANANLYLNNILNASTFVSIIATDSRGVITTFNRGAELMLGYTSDEVVGKHTPALFHDAEEVTKRGQTLSHQTDRPIVGFDVFRTSIGKADFARSEWTYVHKDKHRFTVDLSLNVITSAEGQSVGFIGVAQDVTERHRDARELAKAYENITSVLESTADSVVTISTDWTMVYANHRALRDLTDWQIGKSYWDAFPAIAGTETGDLLRKCMEQRIEVRYELYYEPYKVWFRARAFPVDEGISIFFTDISEEKEMQEKLEHEQVMREKRIEALSHMAGGLAHEISNPLAIIHGRATDLKDQAEQASTLPSAEVITACDHILKTSNRASNILKGLRGFAREARHDPMHWASIYEIIEACLEMQESRFERHLVSLQLDLPDGLPLLLCRETQIGQIVTNLLNNAFDAIVHAHSVERWVSLVVTPRHDGVMLAVTDSGPGIEDHLKKHLMEPFFTTKEVGLGMGVGLSLSRAIAQDHGGSLRLNDEGERTRFELFLPTDPGAVTQGAT